MVVPSSVVASAADSLWEAAANRRPCKPLRGHVDLDVATAYAVQLNVLNRRLSRGERVVGRKIGLTNPAVQRQLGVDQPDFGFLLDAMSCTQDEVIDVSSLLQPRIEAEVAFVLGADIDSPGPLSADEVAPAVAYAVAALEIVDSRIENWDIGIVDTVADNASSGLFVLGAVRKTLREVSPVSVTMRMTRDGADCSTGSGADCLGDPLAALAWLATMARDLGSPLQAGDIILSGALGPMVTVVGGDRFVAEIDGLGTVSATFSNRVTR